MHRRIREMTNKKRNNDATMSTLDANGNLIPESSEVLRTWKLVEQHTVGNTGTGPSFMRTKVEKALLALKNNKAPGLNNIHGEVLNFYTKWISSS